MDDDFRNRMNHPAIKRQKVAIELGELQRQADEIARLRKQVEAADRMAEAISAARVENTDWPTFNALLTAMNAYHATASKGAGLDSHCPKDECHVT